MTIQSIPRAYASVSGTRARFVAPDGRHQTVSAGAEEDIRLVVVRLATAEARRTGTTLELITSGDRGEHRLMVDANGELTAATDEPGREADTVRVAPINPDPDPDPDPEIVQDDVDEASAADIVEEQRLSFIKPQRARTAASSGWRATAARAGIRLPETEARRRLRDDRLAVSQHWAGVRAVAVVNGKGGVGKTMATAMLAAVFARFGGGNVLAWDNNDTRGTLGWRTEQGRYDTTVRDLLTGADKLLEPTAGVSDISRYVHHQSDDRYDVLRSNPQLLASHQRMTSCEFNLLVRVAAHYYRLILFDSGNDESADRWLRMIDVSQQLVVPTLPSAESAESAVLLLEALRDRDEKSAELAGNSVVVVTQPETGSSREAARVAKAFEDQVRAVHVVPYDESLKSGPLRFDELRPRTASAWLRAAASVASGLD